MAGFLDRLEREIRRRDMFGIPVQLTYKGDTAFNTCFGGCVSIIFVVTFIAIFIKQLNTHWNYPQFQNYPAMINYDVQNVYLEPLTGSTVAIAILPVDTGATGSSKSIA